VFQTTPWFMRVYWHTLALHVDHVSVPITFGSHADVAAKSKHQAPSAHGRFVPAVDRSSPGVLELDLLLPYSFKSAALTMNFDRAFLRITDFPPDANHGFEVESALVTVMPTEDFKDPGEWTETSAFPPVSALDEVNRRALLHRIQRTTAEQVCTEGLLLVLASPDFSMPYNVITFSSTVVALAFGSVFGLVLRRTEPEADSPPEEEKKAPAPTGLLGKLIAKFTKSKSE